MEKAAVHPTQQYPILELNQDEQMVIIEGRGIPLTPQEYLILQMIKEAQGAIVHLHQIGMYLPHDKKKDSLSLNTIVNGLKKKLGSTGRSIETILGIGYRLKEN